MAFGGHVNGYKVWKKVVVEVCIIRTHAIERDVVYTTVYFVFESAIFLVDIQLVRFQKIIGNINIVPTIVVKIAYCTCKTPSLVVKFCLASYFCESSAIISVKLVAGNLFNLALYLSTYSSLVFKIVSVVYNIEIQVAIFVVI